MFDVLIRGGAVIDGTGRPRYPAGIEHVLVNGEVAVRFGTCTGALAGRALPR